MGLCPGCGAERFSSFDSGHFEPSPLCRPGRRRRGSASVELLQEGVQIGAAHVDLAEASLRVEDDAARNAVRISMSNSTTDEECMELIRIIGETADGR